MNDVMIFIEKIGKLTRMFIVVSKRDGCRRALQRAKETLFELRPRKLVYFGVESKSLEDAVFKSENETPSEGAVDIVICVHNAPRDTERCIRSVLERTADPYHIIIVDDGSDVETRGVLEKFSQNHSSKVTLVRNEKALGYTFAANRGLRLSRGAYVVLLNSDTIVTPGWIEEMKRCAESEIAIGIVGPLSNTASWQSIPEFEKDGDWAENSLPADITLDEWADALRERSPRIYPKVAFLNGFCLMIKRALINDIGIFDEATFGRGYGEENDYCLRAVEAGWNLVVCDSAYVYHAQSKSYSHEKRKLLSVAAGEALAKKHTQEMIDEGTKLCRESVELRGIRLRASILADYVRAKRRISEKFSGKKIMFVLPVSSFGGGANIVLLEAVRMKNCGVKVTIANLSSNRDGFLSCYPEWEPDTVFFDDSKELAKVSAGYDWVVATANFSVSWIKDADIESKTVLGYYVQDYEPFFYPRDSFERKSAEDSYEAIPNMKLFAKTRWTAGEVKKRHGRNVAVVGESYDENVFAPRAGRCFRERGVVRVCAMIRPSSPRRNPEMTMKVLGALKKKFGKKVDIVIFGTKKKDPHFYRMEHDFPFINLGVLDPKQIAFLFAESDIFIDLSTFQAMGLTAMEAMASGLAVVMPNRGGCMEFGHHEKNCLLVESTDFHKSFSAVSRLVNDEGLRERLSKRAVEDMASRSPIFSAEKILEALDLK